MGHALRSAELKPLGIETYLVKPVKQSRLFDCLISQVRSRAKSKPPASRHPPRASEIEPEFKKAHILLAEDNFISQKVALGQLRRLRYRADSAAVNATVTGSCSFWTVFSLPAPNRVLPLFRLFRHGAKGRLAYPGIWVTSRPTDSVSASRGSSGALVSRPLSWRLECRALAHRPLTPPPHSRMQTRIL
jgi:hypothetical protein